MFNARRLLLMTTTLALLGTGVVTAFAQAPAAPPGTQSQQTPDMLYGRWARSERECAGGDSPAWVRMTFAPGSVEESAWTRSPTSVSAEYTARPDGVGLRLLGAGMGLTAGTVIVVHIDGDVASLVEILNPDGSSPTAHTPGGGQGPEPLHRCR
jgi:hypothetical protein